LFFLDSAFPARQNSLLLNYFGRQEVGVYAAQGTLSASAALFEPKVEKII
jgi:hypothetical protein